MNQRIAIASDVAGRPLRDELIRRVGAVDLTPGGDRNYPSIAEQACEFLLSGQADRLILVCGTGIGMCIAANKVPGIRAALVADVYSASRAARSNDAQVLCLGALTTGVEVASMLVNTWLEGSLDEARSRVKVDEIVDLDRRYRGVHS